MFVVGFATAVEITDLQDQGFEVEDADYYGLVSPSSERRDPDEIETGRESYLLAKPEPSPSKTRAVAIFLDAALYDVLLRLHNEETPAEGSLNVADWVARKMRYINKGDALRQDANNFKYCSHKNPDGSDARYFVEGGMGERACVCGNRWD